MFSTQRPSWRLSLVALILFACLDLNIASAADDSRDVAVLTARAEAGDVEAMTELASAYDSGRGVERNGALALKWYRKAAELGVADAQNSLGSHFQALKKYREARQWYERAAAQNHALGVNNLAYLHDLGLGVPQNRETGFQLYLKSANLGWAEAMWNLANMYGAGQLGSVDMLSACRWTVRANKYALPGWRELRDMTTQTLSRMKDVLSPQDYAACLSDEWTPGAAQPPVADDAKRG